MDAPLIPIIASLVGAATAYFARWAIEKYIRSHKEQEIIIKSLDGKEETLSVKDGTNETQILSALRKERDLEESIYNILKTYTYPIENSTIKLGKFIDFIANIDNKKLGIEVKSNLSHLNIDKVNKYFSEESDLEKLLIFTTSTIPDKLIKRTKRLVDSNKIKYVTLNDEDEREQQIKKILENFRVEKHT